MNVKKAFNGSIYHNKQLRCSQQSTDHLWFQMLEPFKQPPLDKQHNTRNYLLIKSYLSQWKLFQKRFTLVGLSKHKIGCYVDLETGVLGCN